MGTPGSPPPDKGPLSPPTSSRRAALPTPESGRPGSHREPAVDAGQALDGFAFAVLRELTRHVSEPNAKALLAVSASSAGVAVSALTPSHLPLITAQIVRTFGVFGIGTESISQCLVNLRALTGASLGRAEMVVPVLSEADIVTARDAGKQMCLELGFTEVAYIKVATAISELARNIVKFAGQGSITLRVLRSPKRGIEIVATDQGPGIADVEAVLSPKYRSRTGMGVGLRGTRRLMDHFEVKSQVGRGTIVTLRKH